MRTLTLRNERDGTREHAHIFEHLNVKTKGKRSWALLFLFMLKVPVDTQGEHNACSR